MTITESGLLCPKCNGTTEVYNSRPKPNGTTKRWRRCLRCNYHFTTRETVDENFKDKKEG